MRRLLAAVAGLVVALAPYAPARAAGPLRLTVGTVGSIGALDPRTGTSEVAREVWNLQYPTLTTLDPKTLDPAPGLAIAWSPAPNGRGWVYTLRPGATWSDGRPVTADDVVASVERAGGSAHAVGDGEIEIAGDGPGALVNIEPQHVLAATPDLDENLEALGVAAGPWHVTARTDDSVQLAARRDGTAVRQIVFRTYPSPDSLISALDRGEVDVVSGLPYVDAERLGARSYVTVDHAPDGTQYVLANSLPDRARPPGDFARDRPHRPRCEGRRRDRDAGRRPDRRGAVRRTRPTTHACSSSPKRSTRNPNGPASCWRRRRSPTGRSGSPRGTMRRVGAVARLPRPFPRRGRTAHRPRRRRSIRPPARTRRSPRSGVDQPVSPRPRRLLGASFPGRASTPSSSPRRHAWSACSSPTRCRHSVATT